MRRSPCSAGSPGLSQDPRGLGGLVHHFLEWIAKLHTVVRTCQRLAIAPEEYLTWVLPKLSDLPVNRGKGHLGTLTPMAYAEAQAAV